MTLIAMYLYVEYDGAVGKTHVLEYALHILQPQSRTNTSQMKEYDDFECGSLWESYPRLNGSVKLVRCWEVLEKQAQHLEGSTASSVPRSLWQFHEDAEVEV